VTAPADPTFLAGGGEMGALMRAHDWGRSPLGDPSAWPAPLKANVGLMLNSKFAMFIAWGPELGFLYNDHYAAILGQKHPTALGRRFQEIWAEIWTEIAPIVDKALAGEASYLEDLPLIVNRNGYDEQAWFSFSYSPLQDEAGRTAGMFCAVYESTTKALTERRLASERERFAELFAQAPSFMAMLRGPEHRFELTNHAFTRLIGGREVVGLPVREALGDLEGQQFFDLLDNVYTTGTPFVGRAAELWIANVPGAPAERRFLDFVYQPVLGKDGIVSGIFVEGNDVTDLKLANDELRDREQRLRLIVEAATDYAILTMTPDREITSWSTGAAAIFGYAADEVVGRSADIIFTPEDREAAQPQREIDDARVVGCAPDVRWHLRKDGSRVFLNGSTRPLRDDTGQEIGYLKIARDETERLAADKALRDLNASLESRVEQRTHDLLVAEEAMRQSQKMEAVGQLTGGVAHDFNNLLTIIRSSVDLLRRPDLPEERRRRYVDAVSDTVDRAAKLTSQLLSFARRQALKPEVIEVAAQLREVADMLDNVTGARIQVVTDLPDTPCFIEADVSQFETSIINLTVNARDAMDGQGQLVVRLEPGVPMPPIRGHAGAKGPFAAVSVTDTGSGIAADDLTRIFEPFFTTKEVGRGTGLGLSQVFGFTKQSGGDVSVESEVGRGTTFTLYLPQIEPGAAEASAPSDEVVQVAGGAGRRVLVVEDNLEVGRFATQVLEDLGYETNWAVNAEEALERLGYDGAGFDVVFSDVVMPGMGGIALARELGRRLPDMPVVLATGYSHVLAQEGATGFDLLQKPYSAEQLSRILRRVTRGRPAASL
jgi:PAS domain S-box-containing protein